MLVIAIIKLVLFFALVSIPGLSLTRVSSPSSTTFVVRVLIGSGLLAWAGLIVTYFVPALWPLGFFALLAWLMAVWLRCGFAGIVEQLKPARGILAVQLLACLLVLSMGYLYGGFAHPFQAASQRWFHWASDNALPSLALERLASHNFSLMWGWHVSDRPPLQSGFINLLSPFGRREFDNLLVGIVSQSFVVSGAYLLLRTLQVGPRLALAALALFATSGFFVMNSFYTWPKLLSAGYLCAAAALAFSRSHARPALLAGILAGLGCLAHGGGAFALLGLLVVVLCGAFRDRIPWLVAAFMLTALPWVMFTKSVDPPGNSLAKWHLAGITKPDSRGFAETWIESYRTRTPQQIAADKIENVRIQFGELGFYRDALRIGSKSWWDEQFGILAFACFPAWLGIAAILFPSSRSTLAGTLTLQSLWMATLIITCVMMFGPALDVDPSVATARPSLPQQSYFVPALTLVSAGLALLSLPGVLRLMLIAGQLLLSTVPYFFPPVGVSGPLFSTRPAAAGLLVAAAALAGLAWFFLRPLRGEPEARGSA